jgi:hypothetical protein
MNFIIFREKSARACLMAELQEMRAERCRAGHCAAFATYRILQAWIASGVRILKGAASIWRR